MNTTALQKQIFNYQISNPNNTAYNLNYLFKITGPINVTKLTNSVVKVFANHPSLKSNFVYKNADIFSVINQDHSVDIKTIPIHKEEELIKILDAEKGSVFNMASDSLSKVRLFKYEKTVYIYFKFHHLVLDALSFEVLLKEIENEYIDAMDEVTNRSTNKYNNNQDLAPLVQRAVDYEKDIYNGLNSFATPNISKDNGTCVSNGSIDKQMLNRLANKQGLTIFQTLLAVYSYILAQMTFNTKISVGVPFGDYDKKEQGKVGMYVNTIPLCVDINSQQTVTEFLDQIKEKMKMAKSISKVDVVGMQDRIFSSNYDMPLNCLITYYKNPQTLHFPNCNVEKISIEPVDAITPFNVIFENNINDVEAQITTPRQYSRSHYADIFNRVVYQMIQNSHQQLDNLTMLNDMAVHSIYSQVNVHNSDYNTHLSTLVELFKEKVVQSPNNECIKDENNVYSYDQIDQLSDKAAAFLDRYKDIKSIAVSVNPSYQLIALIIGIFKAGKTYIPVDKFMPNDRKEKIYKSLDNYLVVLDSGQGNLAKGNIKLTNIFNSKIDSLEISNKSNLNQIAYVLFTSGSTGTPKGVPVLHKNISSLFSGASQVFNFSSKDHWTLFHSYGFDFSIWEIFGCLTTGGRLTIVPTNKKMYPDYVNDLLTQDNISVLCQTPSSLQNLIQYQAKVKDMGFKKFQDPKYIFVGAEFVSHEMIKKWFQLHSNSKSKIIALYGVTEGAICSFFKDISHINDDFSTSDVLGKTLPNSVAYIQSLSGQINPIGFLGQIVIGGDGISTRYYKNTGKNSRSFATKSLLVNNNSFYTNDLGFVNQNFDVVFKGRNDQQVKVGGHRIEIGEVESILKKYSDCNDAIVLLRKFANNDNRLVGYCISNSQKIDLEDLREYLKGKLQKYMIPSFLIQVPKRPLTVNGKLDKTQLPLPELKTKIESADKNTPTKIIISIWEKILHHDQIKSEDNFFDVGGSSVLLTEVYFEIVDAFNLNQNDISMVDLFEYTTPREVADFLTRDILNRVEDKNG